jgi:hypothetical protein
MPTGSEQERLHRRIRDPERTTELPIRETTDLAKQQRAPLPARQARDRGPDRFQVGGADCGGERIGRSEGSSVSSSSLRRAWIRARHSLRAIAASQACGSRGGAPPSTDRCAARKTCCVASSASTGSRSSSRQSPSTIRLCSVMSLPTKEPAASGSRRPAECLGFGALVVSALSVVSYLPGCGAAVVVVVLVFALVVIVVALVVVGLRGRTACRQVQR